MRLVKPSYEIISMAGSAKSIEYAGRTCYKSEDKITDDSADKFVRMVRDRGHHSVIEHSMMSVKIICDRGVTHEIVRHRLCAFSQESTRYVNYKGGCTFVIPPWVDLKSGEYEHLGKLLNTNGSVFDADYKWVQSMLCAERDYVTLLELDWSPQQARSVLPNSTKTEIIVTANFREWHHIFTLRCSEAAHPQMREVMIPLLEECKSRLPVIFEDIKY